MVINDRWEVFSESVLFRCIIAIRLLERIEFSPFTRFFAVKGILRGCISVTDDFKHSIDFSSSVCLGEIVRIKKMRFAGLTNTSVPSSFSVAGPDYFWDSWGIWFCEEVLILRKAEASIVLCAHSLLRLIMTMVRSRFPLRTVADDPCIHVSMYPCIHVSMYPCIHVSSR
jgi:hypothetical protein